MNTMHEYIEETFDIGLCASVSNQEIKFRPKPDIKFNNKAEQNIKHAKTRKERHFCIANKSFDDTF